MAQCRKLLVAVRGNRKNVAFRDFLHLARCAGFEFVEARGKGGHGLLIHPREEVRSITAKPRNNRAMPYLVKALLREIDEHSLMEDDEDEDEDDDEDDDEDSAAGR